MNSPHTSQPAHPLTARQRRFIAEYLKDGNATGAYRRAGYGGGANANGPRLCRHPRVAAAIDVACAERMARARAAADARVADLAAIAFADDRDLTGPDGHPIPLAALPPAVRATLVVHPDGHYHRRDRLSALADLLRRFTPPPAAHRAPSSVPDRRPAPPSPAMSTNTIIPPQPVTRTAMSTNTIIPPHPTPPSTPAHPRDRLNDVDKDHHPAPALPREVDNHHHPTPAPFRDVDKDHHPEPAHPRDQACDVDHHHHPAPAHPRDHTRDVDQHHHPTAPSLTRAIILPAIAATAQALATNTIIPPRPTHPASPTLACLAATPDQVRAESFPWAWRR